MDMDTLTMIHQLKVSLWDLSYTYWTTETISSIKWWSLIALNVIGYAIWWIIVDKRRLSQLLLFGSLVSVGRIVMDIIGTNIVFWSYDIREMPFFPSPFIHDFTISPLSLMLVYQYSPTWKKFLIWSSVIIGIISFGFFPLLVRFGFLQLYNWKLFYSFILMILLAALSRAVVLGVLKMEQRYQCNQTSKSSAILTCQPAMKPLDKEENSNKND
jgi:hypothetical protein